MTAPDLLDVTPPLPYSVTWFAAGNGFMYPDISQRGSWSNSYYRHRLGPGTYILQVVYLSLGKRLTLSAQGGETLHVLEEGQTGWVRSPMIQVAVRDNEETFLTLTSNQKFENGPEKAALNVYPMARYKP